MLEVLRIKNFAVIVEQEVEFGAGLNVITGETGSGKSVLLQALGLILGERTKPNYIRNGSDLLEIEALFDLSTLEPNLKKSLPDLVEDSDQLLLYRSYSRAGRSRVLINGKLASVSMLEEISKKLINICSQGAYISLLDPKQHLNLLDDFAQTGSLLDDYQASFSHYRNLSKELTARQQAREQSALRRVELEFIAEELSQTQLEPGIRGKFEAQVKKMSLAESLTAQAQEVQLNLQDGEGALSQLLKLRQSVQDMARQDSELNEAMTLFNSAVIELQEFSRSIGSYISQLVIDEEGLQHARDQLAEIARLERKYRMSDSELVALLIRSQNELTELDSEDSLKELTDKVKEAKQAAEKIAGRLSKKRKKSALELAKQVTVELQELNMPDASLLVNLESIDLSPWGLENAEYMVITNKGDSPKPLRSIASGGELSRILLVLKKILRERTGVNVLVFDEVDSGVSGKVARAMGQKLKDLAQGTQVLCITHLAQVASLADRHLQVSKEVGNRAESKIKVLSQNQQVEEIARMLAGYKVTEASRATAKELLAS